MKIATLTFCLRDDQILLGMKKVRFGAGKWNGFGGKVDAGESIREAAARELFEESSLAVDPDDLHEVARIQFYFGEKSIYEGHIFIAHVWRGEPQESEEMRPQWFSITDIPYDHMWAADGHWLPLVLEGKRIKGVCRFDEAGKVVEDFTIEEAIL